MVAPGIAATAILCFLYAWNDFFFALILTRTNARTAPVAVVNFMNYEGWEWGKIAAGGSLVMAPVLIFSLAVRRYLVSGLTAGAVKGIDMQLPTGASRFVFILAHPTGHVSAPRYYSPYFRESGLDWHMVPLDVAPEHLAETIRTLAKSRSVAGFNLTMPHKPAGVCALRYGRDLPQNLKGLSTPSGSKPMDGWSENPSTAAAF